MPDSLPPRPAGPLTGPQLQVGDLRWYDTIVGLTTDGDQPPPPVAGIVTRETMARAAPQIAPLVGEARSAADALQAALESGEPLAVTRALDRLVDLGQSAFHRLVTI